MFVQTAIHEDMAVLNPGCDLGWYPLLKYSFRALNSNSPRLYLNLHPCRNIDLILSDP
jgi:hypothetical protein